MINPTFSRPMRFRRQCGLSLIEVLISMLVLSIGLVGLGALHMTALKTVNTSVQFSTASAIALDLEERFWEEIASVSAVNPDELTAEGCLVYDNENDDHVNALIATFLNEWTGDSSTWEWSQASRFQLPDLGVTVLSESINAYTAKDADGNDLYTLYHQVLDLRVSWTESRVPGEDEPTTAEYDIPIIVICRPQYPVA